MIASLPMYDRAETREINDTLWRHMRDDLGLGPRELTRSDDVWSDWQNPALLLSQTCSLPYRTRLARSLTIVASPDYGLQDAPQGYYYSVIVVRADDRRTSLSDFKGTRLARNDAFSQSGWASIWDRAGPFGAVIDTGSHRGAAEAVAQGEADLAAIDVVSWNMMTRWDGFTETLRVIAKTPPTPGLPFVTAVHVLATPLRAALTRGIQKLGDDERQALGLFRVVSLPRQSYLSLSTPPLP